MLYVHLANHKVINNNNKSLSYTCLHHVIKDFVRNIMMNPFSHNHHKILKKTCHTSIGAPKPTNAQS